MNASVRWVRVRDKEEPALVIECEKFANAILMDFPIYVYTYDKRLAAKCRPVLHKGEPYPVKRNIHQFIKDAEFHGITPGARRLMMAVLNGEEDIPDCKPSENQVTETAQKKAFGEAYADARVEDMDPPPKPEVKAVRAAPTGRILARTPDSDVSDPESKPQRIPRPSGDGKRGNVVQQLAEKLGVEGAEVRKRLRKAGLRQPYGSLEECLRAIG